MIPGKTEPYLNIMDPKVNWNPTKEIDFDGDGEPDFRIDASLSAILSIDSNDDHIPDLNIDLDGDYVADLNIDVNGNRKTAQTNIDTTGDGKADINIDTNGDGTPDSRIATNYEWKPTYLVKDKEGNVMYGTTQEIKLDTIDSVTDQGFIIKPSDSTQQFLPNYALKVSDITASMTEEMKQEIVGSSKKEDYEIAGVYEITLKANDKIIQPDGSVEVSVPYDEAWGEAILMKKNKHGDWEEVNAELVNGYLTFTTDYIGEVSILKQKQDDTKPEPEPTTPEPNPTEPNDSQKPTTTNSEPSSTTNEPKPSVQGVYTPYSNTGMGGARTWDSTNIMLYLGGGFTTLGILALILYKRESNGQ